MPGQVVQLQRVGFPFGQWVKAPSAPTYFNGPHASGGLLGF
jgi:hypothetical protein